MAFGEKSSRSCAKILTEPHRPLPAPPGILFLPAAPPRLSRRVEQSGGHLRFPGMSRFDKYRPRYEVVPIMALIAAFSIAGLLMFEVEKPRLSHRPELPTIGTQSAAEEAGARLTPSNPAETKSVDMRRPAIVNKRNAD